MKSIIPQEEGTCFLCTRLNNDFRLYSKYDLECHHVFYGTANRKMSEKYGMKIMLCRDHHKFTKEAVHNNPINDDYCKKFAQKIFEKKYSHEKFMEVFGKSWL